MSVATDSAVVLSSCPTCRHNGAMRQEGVSVHYNSDGTLVSGELAFYSCVVCDVGLLISFSGAFPDEKQAFRFLFTCGTHYRIVLYKQKPFTKVKDKFFHHLTVNDCRMTDATDSEMVSGDTFNEAFTNLVHKFKTYGF
jgi:hypothetical protein